MKKCRKVISLVLALVMLLSAASVALTASALNKKSLYTDKNALNGKMNGADKYELADEQYATIMLDFADKMLAQANIPVMTIALNDSFKIQIDATSCNGLNKTLKGLGDKIDDYKSFLGEIGDMDFSMFKDSTYRDDSTSASDVAFIQAFVTFLKNNSGAVGKVVRKGIGTENGQLNPGKIVNNFIPDNIKELTSDIVGFLKETLFQDKNASFDANVATLITDLVNGMELEMLEGFTFSSNDSIYSLIDKVVRALTKWAIKNVQEDTWHFKDMILNAVPDFEEQYPFVDLDAITTITWDWKQDGMGDAFVAGTPSTYIVYHINNLLGEIVTKLIPEFKNFTGSLGNGISDTAGWKKDNGTTSLTTLNENLAKAAQFADIKLNNGGTFTLEEAAQLQYPIKTYAMVLADAMLKMFFPSLKVEKTDIEQGNICVLAVQALNEFFHYYLPDKTLTTANGYSQNLYTYNAYGTVLNRTYYTEARCQKIYKSMLALVLKKFSSGYFPKDKIGFTNITNLEATDNLDNILKDLAKYFLNHVCQAGALSEGALGTVGSSEEVYTAVDRIIFSLNTSGTYVDGCSNSGARNVTGILPKGFLPAKYNTSKKVINLLFSAVENLNFGSLFELLVPNSSNTEMTEKLLPNLGCYEVIRIINVLFPKTWTSKTNSLDALITNDNLGNILQSILSNLNMNYHVFPALTLVATMMGLSTAQQRGEAEVSLAKQESVGGTIVYTEIEPVIDTSSATIPGDYYIKVNNTSKGIPGGYHNVNYEERPWVPYSICVYSIVCETDSRVKVGGIGATGTTIESASEAGFPISGTADSGSKALRFMVTYAISDEDGANYGAEQQARFQVYLGTTDYQTLTSKTVTATVPTTIYGSPSMVSDTIGYIRTSNADATNSGSGESTVFPAALESAGFKMSAADVGTPSKTSNELFKPFTISVPSSVEVSNYTGNYTISYNLKTKDTSADNASYGDSVTKNVQWVLFDDGGLPGLVSKYESMELQSFDFENVTLWNAFQNELAKATKMIKDPSKTSTVAATLQAAFAAEAEALTEAYEALAESSTADYSGLLKERLVTYSDGDEENGIRPLHTMWDYTPVSYARYSSSLDTVKSYYNNNEISSVKVNEALRYNEAMAQSNLLFADSDIEATLTNARENLQTVKNAYQDESMYSVDNYTLESQSALKEALEDAKVVLMGRSLDRTREARISDYADARANILKSLNQLVEQPLSVSGLYNAILGAEDSYKTEVSAKSASDTRKDNMYYTDEAWERFLAAMESGYHAINNPQEVIDETADGTIDSANALITNKYQQEITDAIAYLEAHPYVSRLNSKKASVLTFNYGDSTIAGARVIDEANIIVLPFGVSGKTSGLTPAIFGFSKNVSRYTYEDKLQTDGTYKREWSTYGGADCTLQGYTTAAATTKVGSTAYFTTGNIIRVTDSNTNNYIDYTVVVTGNIGSKVNGVTLKGTEAFLSGKDMQKTLTALKAYLPKIVKHSGEVKDMSDAVVLACDLNRDGKVDVTDLVMLKQWENGNCPLSLYS